MNTTSIAKLVPGIAAGLMGLSLTCAHAVVLFEDDFESDTIGQNPAGWTITDNPPTGPDISVVAGSSTGGDAPNLKLLNFNSNGSTENYRATHGFTSTNSGIIEFSLSMRFNSVAEANPFIQILGSASAGYIGARSATTTGTTAGFYYYANGSNTAVSILSNIIEADWYRITLTLNLDTDKWSFRVSNLNNASSNQQAFVDDLGFWQATSRLSGFKIERAPGGSTGNFDIDDVVVQTVPEPSTTALLFGGALAVGGMLWRKRRTQR